MLFFNRNKKENKKPVVPACNNQTKDCDYVIFDLETSSLNSRHAEIIEISAIKVANGQIVNYFSSLVQPYGELDTRALAVNKITIDMLKEAPKSSKVFPSFLNYIGSNRLMGYNIASFDMPILRRYASTFGVDLSNDYEDIFYLAKKKLPDLPNHKLSTIASYFVVNTDEMHRALQDCLITNKCYEHLLSLPDASYKKAAKQHRAKHSAQTTALQDLHALIMGIMADNRLTDEEVVTLNNWLDSHIDLSGNYPYDRIQVVVKEALADGFLEQRELDEMLDLFQKYLAGNSSDKSTDVSIRGKAFVLTGDFKFGEKKEVERLIVKNGGVCRSSVSSKTDYVVVGAKGSSDWSFGNYGTKIKKAKELQSSGAKVVIIGEDDLFLCMGLE